MMTENQRNHAHLNAQCDMVNNCIFKVFFPTQELWPLLYLMSTSFVISTSSPSMFQGKAAPSDWMMGVVLELLSSSLSSSDRLIAEEVRILTADTACVSTKEKLNCKRKIRRSERQTGPECARVKGQQRRSEKLVKILVVKQIVDLQQWLGFFLFIVLLSHSELMEVQQRAAETHGHTLSVHPVSVLTDCSPPALRLMNTFPVLGNE